MNNKELIAELSQRTGFSQQTTKKMVLTMLDDYLSRVVQEGVLQVPTFGTFEVKKRLERVIVSPNNGKKLLVPPKLVINFRPTSAYKERLQKGGDDE